jgi:DNA processing protein
VGNGYGMRLRQCMRAMDPAIAGYAAEDVLGPLNCAEARHAPLLGARGCLTLLRRQPRVAVVGACNAAPSSLEAASLIAKALASQGATLVSAFDEPLADAVHAAAIAAGDRSIAVAEGAVEPDTVLRHPDMQQVLLRDHLVTWPVHDNARGTLASIRARGKTLALLANATIIVDASPSKDVEFQAWEALRLQRPLFLSEALVRPRRPQLEWPLYLLGRGARVLSARTLERFVQSI